MVKRGAHRKNRARATQKLKPRRVAWRHLQRGDGSSERKWTSGQDFRANWRARIAAMRPAGALRLANCFEHGRAPSISERFWSWSAGQWVSNQNAGASEISVRSTLP